MTLQAAFWFPRYRLPAPITRKRFYIIFALSMALVMMAAVTFMSGASKQEITTANGFTWWERGAEKPLLDSPALPHSFIWPITRVDVSSPFGIRDGQWHRGVDLRGPKGTPILAAAGGAVVYSGMGEAGYGNTVIIDHGEGVQTLYSHNNRNVFRAGAIVPKGETIAYVGKTGAATGYHVHFEIRLAGRPLDPAKLLPPLHSSKP
ncbi:MAG: M23 family metallopeptidase [Nitrospinota bacterium]|nr:M23 family metallopeptidase [Nitrospinota bacterium]